MIILYLVVLVLLSAWFSGMEIALFSLSSGTVKDLVLNKKPNAQLLQKILKNKNNLLVVILLGNNLVNISAASLATLFAIEEFGSAAAGIVTGIMTITILIFGEIFPKAYFRINAAKMSLIFAPLMYFIQTLLYPISMALEYLIKVLTKGKKVEIVSEQEFKAFSRLAVEKGVLDFEEHEMIMNILSFNDKIVKDVMTPFYKVSLLNDEADIDQVAYFVAQESYSRYPVYHNQRDNIIGYIHVMDIMGVLNSKNREDSVGKHITPILRVKETRKIDSLFNLMIKKRSHMALVEKANSQIVGLITLEDLLEEIVGDIHDETDF